MFTSQINKFNNHLKNHFYWNVIKVFGWDKPLIKDKVESDRVKLYMENTSKLNGGKGGVGGWLGGVCNFCYILVQFDVVSLMVQFLGLSE
jgi:hypothetical protein